jgi:hypothetical protein
MHRKAQAVLHPAGVVLGGDHEDLLGADGVEQSRDPTGHGVEGDTLGEGRHHRERRAAGVGVGGPGEGLARSDVDVVVDEAQRRLRGLDEHRHLDAEVIERGDDAGLATGDGGDGTGAVDSDDGGGGGHDRQAVADVDEVALVVDAADDDGGLLAHDQLQALGNRDEAVESVGIGLLLAFAGAAVRIDDGLAGGGQADASDEGGHDDGAEEDAHGDDASSGPTRPPAFGRDDVAVTSAQAPG